MKKEVNISSNDDQPLSKANTVIVENTNSLTQNDNTNNPIFDFKEIENIFNVDLNEIYDNFKAKYEQNKLYTKKR